MGTDIVDELRSRHNTAFARSYFNPPNNYRYLKHRSPFDDPNWTWSRENEGTVVPSFSLDLVYFWPKGLSATFLTAKDCKDASIK